MSCGWAPPRCGSGRVSQNTREQAIVPQFLVFCRKGGAEIWECAQNRTPCGGEEEGNYRIASAGSFLLAVWAGMSALSAPVTAPMSIPVSERKGGRTAVQFRSVA